MSDFDAIREVLNLVMIVDRAQPLWEQADAALAVLSRIEADLARVTARGEENMAAFRSLESQYALQHLEKSKAEVRVVELEKALRDARTNIGLTVYEGTSVSVASGKRICEKISEALGEAGE